MVSLLFKFTSLFVEQIRGIESHTNVISSDNVFFPSKLGALGGSLPNIK